MYFIGYDSGTSSIKATLMEGESGKVVASATYPEKEMTIISHQSGWAEQNPGDWWANLKTATAILLKDANIDAKDIKGIGITYQMHGLVCIDKNKNVLRPSIIWCDSRAVPYGQKATDSIGDKKCLETLLNHPGNFTAAKLAWVKENEPGIYNQIDKIMLPGDYLAMMMTDSIVTTKSGLSEGIFWNIRDDELSKEVMDAFGFENSLIPDTYDTFGIHGELTSSAAADLSLAAGTPVSYRAGDQPNNAFSLGVMEPGEIAATAGTSGVVYGVADSACFDSQSRVNTFIHVNNTSDQKRLGVLLCINGTGILNSWIKKAVGETLSYTEMNELATAVSAGSDGISILPFGNGAERSLGNKQINSSIHGINFNIHNKAHLARAAQEGIVFAFNYGMNIMKEMGLKVTNIRAGQANMFQSRIFAEALATITDAEIELYNTDGSQGAARGAGIGIGYYKDQKDAFVGLTALDKISPNNELTEQYVQAYSKWIECLKLYI